MSSEVIGLITGVVSFLAYIVYIYNIWWGNTRPSRSSWWILTVVWTVLFLSSLSLENGMQSTGSDYLERAIQISYIVGSLLIAVSTIWRGQNQKWGVLDFFCAASAFVALILYSIFSVPLLSMLIAILADLFGIIPTIVNANKYPQSEHKMAWTIETLVSLLALGTIGIWNFSHESISLWLPVLYLIIVNSIITILIWKGRYYAKS